MTPKSLFETSPELSLEWHPTKNGNLSPYNISAGSDKKVWWYLPYDDPSTGKHFDFEWQAAIYNRVRGDGCPFISFRALWPGFNDLATINPELSQEWHPTKNGNKTPADVTARSGEIVWWYLPYDDPQTGKHFDFEWQASVSSRTRGTRCPFFTGKAVWPGYNDLATTHPELAKEWHPSKNGSLSPSNISAKSGKKVWWYLPYDDPQTGKHFDFEWQAYISHRSTGQSVCPYISGHAIWPGYNDLTTTNPELAKEWHPTKNGDLLPQKITAGSSLKVWWYLPYDDPTTGKHFDFEWQAYIGHRAKGIGCPYLSNFAVWQGFNDLATTHPELAKEWHPTKNGKLKPSEVTKGYDQKVWWYLPYDDPTTGKHFDFEWQVRIVERLRGYDCPFVSNQRVWTGFNDLATTHPELAKEWHPVKNGNLTPTQIPAGSERKIWWYLPYDDPATGKHFDFEWQAAIYHRVSGMGCPFISGKAVWEGYNDLATTNPALAKQWHPTKNGRLKATDITANSNKKVWWYLPYDDPQTGKHFDFEWNANVVSRHKGSGCPFLSNQAVWRGFNDLATTNPELAKEWHPTKNGSIKPIEVTSGANKIVWWMCSNNHVWKAHLGDRRNGSGCPICAETRGERRIRIVLEGMNISFVAQYAFSAMKHINTLRCDFAVLNSDQLPIAVIEYNGEQHYEPVDFAGKGEKWALKSFEVTQKRDRIKATYLNEQGIPLLEIPYWEFDNIEELLNDFIKKLPFEARF